jgi:hypothetical protein
MPQVDVGGDFVMAAAETSHVRWKLTVAFAGGGFGQAVWMRRHCCWLSTPRSSFAGFRFPPDVMVVAVRWYLRYGLSYRDVEELLAERGITVDPSSHVHTLRCDLWRCIWERTVNPSADAFQGSNS